ncbi:Uncharacterised protein [Dermatophilus congolensis]|uniref:Uncharacterized protein n=1 Tax=Dermatophilus congolensis TaxID=1863 RepID=A0A239VUX7_9MICO|nr:Uncharacterised protein [Dermatophilus congolensis]
MIVGAALAVCCGRPTQGGLCGRVVRCAPRLFEALMLRRAFCSTVSRDRFYVLWGFVFGGFPLQSHPFEEMSYL